VLGSVVSRWWVVVFSGHQRRFLLGVMWSWCKRRENSLLLNTYRSRLQVLHGFQSERACANGAYYCYAGVGIAESMKNRSIVVQMRRWVR
jgi:hypothetical protein